MAGKTLAAYAAEAVREPFSLDLGDGKPVLFPQPTFAELLEVQSATDDVIEVLQALAPEADRERLKAALEATPPSVPRAVYDDLIEAFGIKN